MIRRVVAAYTMFCLLAVTFFVAPPAVPTLVCRMTGRPMVAVAATPDTQQSCCAVAVSEETDGTHFALTSPGCCDLRFTANPKIPVTATPTTPDFPVVAVLVPIQTISHFPATEALAGIVADWRQDVPRGPPSRTSSPRAPPFLS